MNKTLKDWLDWQETLHPSTIDLGLERVTQVLKRLCPQFFDHQNKQTLPFKLITVAGTNGKGSTIAFLQSILIQSGYRTGVYTSPHIQKYNERMSIDQQLIADQYLCDLFTQIDKARGQISLTYFEFSTLAAILYFQQSDCDVVILEVGLGGRLDAVNCLDADCALVTTVDWDHQDWLGDSLEKIGLEKAGIFRPHRAAIYGDDQCPQSLIDYAQKINSHFFMFSQDYGFTLNADHKTWNWLCDTLSTQYNALKLPNLRASVQIKNVTNAIMVLNCLHKKLPQVSEQTIYDGIVKTFIAGRLEKIKSMARNSQGMDILIDVAHNPQAVETLANYLSQNPIEGKTYAIFSLLADKDLSAMIKNIAAYVDQWSLYTLDDSRAKNAQEIADEMITMMGDISLACYNDFVDCFLHLIDKMSEQDKQQCRIIVFGSFLIVADAKRYFYG